MAKPENEDLAEVLQAHMDEIASSHSKAKAALTVVVNTTTPSRPATAASSTPTRAVDDTGDERERQGPRTRSAASSTGTASGGRTSANGGQQPVTDSEWGTSTDGRQQTPAEERWSEAEPREASGEPIRNKRKGSSTTPAVGGTPRNDNADIVRNLVSSAVHSDMTEALTRLLDGQVYATPAGGIKRVFGQSRPYNTLRTKKAKVPVPDQSLVPIASISDGSAFPAKKFNTGGPTCCLKRRCNERWTTEKALAIRDAVPKRGGGQQKARHLFVKRCIQQSSTGEIALYLGQGMEKHQVCKLTGCSKRLISAATFAGDPGMARRTMVDTKADAIKAWLTVLADKWEKQPDSREINLSYPDKLGDRPSYEYFVNVWNAQCGHIKLKKSMRSTLCDICVLAKEALDKHRENGSSSALTAPISTGLNDHYEDVRRMRQLPLHAKQRAICSPDELLVIAIDGSGQSSYVTPYFSQVTKDTCAGWRMRMKLIGALVYGRLLHFFTVGSNWESGSNLTIEVLHRTLVALREGQAGGVALPRKLHLQCDNGSRENDNRRFASRSNLRPTRSGCRFSVEGMKTSGVPSTGMGTTGRGIWT